MKKIFSVFVFLLVAILSFAQNAGTATQPANESINVDSVFFLMGAAMVSFLLFIIIYSLSQAVRALSSQVNSKG